MPDPSTFISDEDAAPATFIADEDVTPRTFVPDDVPDLSPVKPTLSPELQAKKSDLQSQMTSARVGGFLDKAAIGAADIGERVAYTISQMDPFEIGGRALKRLLNPNGARISKEQIHSAFHPGQGDYAPGSVEGAIGDFIEESISSMTEPDVAAMLALGKTSPQLVGRFFQDQMIRQSPEAVARLVESKTPAEAVKGGLETAASIGFPALIEAGLRPKAGPPIPDTPGSALRQPFQKAEPTEATKQAAMLELGQKAQDLEDLAGPKTPPIVRPPPAAPPAPTPVVPPKPSNVVSQNEIATKEQTAGVGVPTPGERLSIAVRFPNGEIQKGKEGERIHAQIYSRLWDENHPNLISKKDPDVESGWVDDKGTFWTNEEVEKAVGYKPDSFRSGGIQIPSRTAKSPVVPPVAPAAPVEVAAKTEVVATTPAAISEAVNLAQSLDPMNMGALIGSFQHAHKAGYTGKEAQQAAWSLYEAARDDSARHVFQKAGDWFSKTKRLEELLREVNQPSKVPGILEQTRERQTGYEQVAQGGVVGKSDATGTGQVPRVRSQPEELAPSGRGVSAEQDRGVETPIEPTPPPAAAPAPPAAKEPWQMTWDEYSTWRKAQPGSDSEAQYYSNVQRDVIEQRKANPSLPYDETFQRVLADKMAQSHRYEVEQALRNGKDVPKEVLADYPDLAKPAPPASSVGLPAPVDTSVGPKPKRAYSGERYRADAEEFKNLVEEHGLDHGWISVPDMDKIIPGLKGKQTSMSSASMAAIIPHNAVLKKAYLQALKDLGIPSDRNTLKGHAEALPKLKALLEKHASMVSVPLAKMPDGSKFTRLGEEHTVANTNQKTGMVTIKDGVQIRVHMDDSVKIDPGSLKTPEASKPTLTLDQPESVDQQNARLETEKAAALKKAQGESAKSGAAKPLVGSTGDIGQRDMLGGDDLFSAPPKPAAPEKGMPPSQDLGAAVPAAFDNPETFVSNMFAAIDRDRVAMGKPPMGETRPRTWDEDNQRALTQMNRDPNWIPDMLDRMEKVPRPLLSWENAGVVWHRAKLKAEYNGALQRIARAFDDGRTEDLTTAKVDAAVFEDQLERLDRIVGRNGTGSEAGRSLNAQKMGAGDDFTLIEMTLQKRAAVGGRRLTPQETSAIQKDVDRLNSLNAALQKSLADAEAKASNSEAARAIAELKSKSVLAFDKRVLAAAESIVVKMEGRAVDAAARLREKLKQLSAGVDPTIIYDASVIGSAKIARLGLDLAKFTDAMIADFGEKIRPLISEIWKKSNEMLEANLARVPEPIRRVVRKPGTPDVKQEVAQAVKANVDAGDMSKITFQIQKLCRELIKTGITDRESLIDAVHDVLKDVIPGIDRRGTMDAISGYGSFKRLSKDHISLTLRGMKGEMQQLAKLEDMAAGNPPLKTGIERREPTPEERRLIKEVNDAKNKFQIPISNPETQLKSALDTIKATLKTRIADFEDRLALKDYAPRPRREIQLDTEATRLKAESERIKKRWRQALLSDRMKNRTTWEKALDWGTKFRRFTALSSPAVIPKLLGAAGWRAVATLAEDVSGRGLSFIPGVRQISQRAPLEGYGGQLSATMRGFGAAFTRGLQDAADVTKTGHSDIDVLYGKANESYTGESEMASVLLGLPGRLHGTIKAPVKRAAFEKAVQRLGEFYARQGLDVTSEPVKMKIAIEAYKVGNRAIFLQDNRVAAGFNAALSALEKKGETGHPSVGGKVLATTARFMFPITKVPTNIAAETLQYSTGSVTGSVRAINAIRKGLDTLTPDQADLIMRELKKGSIGLAALYLGYMGYQSVGGVYEQGKKHKPGDVKPDAARLFDVDIPGNLLHHPVINTIQLGATVHRTAEDKLRKKDPDAQGIPAGVLAASWGLAEEVPFIQGPSRLFQGLKSPYSRQLTIGNEIGSVVIPQAIAYTAQVLDQRRETPPTNLYQRFAGPPARLKPRTIGESLKTRIPGLRQQVPLNPKAITPASPRTTPGPSTPPWYKFE